MSKKLGQDIKKTAQKVSDDLQKATQKHAAGAVAEVIKGKDPKKVLAETSKKMTQEVAEKATQEVKKNVDKKVDESIKKIDAAVKKADKKVEQKKKEIAKETEKISKELNKEIKDIKKEIKDEAMVGGAVVARRRCPRGMIYRRPYTRRVRRVGRGRRAGSMIRIKGKCIPDKGRKGKGPKLITIKQKGILTQFGYGVSKTEAVSRAALVKAARKYTPLSTLRRLVAIRTLNKSNPKTYNKLDKDVKFLQRKYFSK